MGVGVGWSGSGGGWRGGGRAHLHRGANRVAADLVRTAPGVRGGSGMEWVILYPGYRIDLLYIYISLSGYNRFHYVLHLHMYSIYI